jgi:2,3-dihydroxybenzoate-AMP ligase
MLDGVTPVPADFAARYRERGYWADQPLFEGFTGALARYAGRTALVDETGPVTYRELSDRSAHLARILLDLGFGPLDRIILQLPNTAMFAYLYFALQRIGAAPVLALPGHRKREITQFAEISGARALAVPAAVRGFDFTAMAAEVMASNPAVRLCFVQGADGPQPETRADPRFVRLEDLLEREPRASAQALAAVSIDPADPALFLLSGGTTGIPKLIPRTHNDYLYNSKIAAAVCEIGADDVLLDVLPIEHNLPLGCPGLQGFLLSGGTVVLGASTRPREVFELIQRHRVTHIHLVPALLIRWIDDPAITEYDLSSLRVIQSGGQRLQPEVRLRAERALPGCFIQENFGMAEGRVKDLINRGGEKISAEEVENLILAHPAVLNVACVPYPDPVLGERMCACLVLRPGQSLSLEELVAFLRGFEIATFKLPERAAFFDSLPLSGFGKVSKKELAAFLASEG